MHIYVFIILKIIKLIFRVIPHNLFNCCGISLSIIYFWTAHIMKTYFRTLTLILSRRVGRAIVVHCQRFCRWWWVDINSCLSNRFLDELLIEFFEWFIVSLLFFNYFLFLYRKHKTQWGEGNGGGGSVGRWPCRSASSKFPCFIIIGFSSWQPSIYRDLFSTWLEHWKWEP